MVSGFLRRELLGRASVPGSRSRRLFEFVGRRYESFRYPVSTLDDVSVDKPIFIIGSPRSGTSILYNTFRRHPDLAYICQGHNLFPHCAVFADRLFRLLGAHLSLDVPARARGTWATLQWQRGGYYYSEGNRVWNLFDSRRNINTTGHEIAIQEKEFYQRFVKKILRTSGKKRFVNKTPALSLRVAYLTKIFPDAVFIHILRDGRAVARSIMEKFEEFSFRPKDWIADPELVGQLDGASRIVQCGLMWLATVRTVQSSLFELEARQSLTLRYEDLISDPATTLKQAYSVCDLNSSFRIDISDINFYNNRNDKWKSELDRDEIRQLEALLGPTLSKLGY